MEFSNSATKKQKEEMLEIERKAREGDAVSNMILFQRYRDGNVVLRDIKKSFEYLEVAVSKHYAPAEYDLGYLFIAEKMDIPLTTIKRRKCISAQRLKTTQTHLII